MCFWQLLVWALELQSHSTANHSSICFRLMGLVAMTQDLDFLVHVILT